MEVDAVIITAYVRLKLYIIAYLFIYLFIVSGMMRINGEKNNNK